MAISIAAFEKLIVAHPLSDSQALGPLAWDEGVCAGFVDEAPAPRPPGTGFSMDPQRKFSWGWAKSGARHRWRHVGKKWCYGLGYAFLRQSLIVTAIDAGDCSRQGVVGQMPTLWCHLLASGSLFEEGLQGQHRP